MVNKCKVTYVHTYIHTCIHTYIRPSIHPYIQTHLYIVKLLYIYIYIGILYTQLVHYACANICAHTHATNMQI